MNNNSKKHSILKYLLGVFLLVILLFGTTYAIFNYTKVGGENSIITGDLYLNLVSGTDSIYLQNVYPMSTSKARERDDNFITFTVNGKNTSTKENIYYEIDLVNGDEETGLTRFNPEHLVFDLIEVGENDEETYLLDAVSFPDINSRKIWIDTVLKETTTEIERTYKLRMWLDENVIISDTDPDKDYTASTGENDFKDHYASVKVKVSGDLKAKSLPSSVITRSGYVENGKSYFRVNLSNDYLMEEEGDLLTDDDVVRIVITNPENKIYFTYKDNEGNDVTTRSESLDLTYVYNHNKTVQMYVYTESKNDVNVSTELNFKIYKNGTLVQEYNKRIDVVGNNYCLNNGFTNLANCLLVTENLSNNVASAKAYIASKGAPDTTKTAPMMEYTYYSLYETPQQNVVYNNVIHNWYFSDSYTFDTERGVFLMQNTDGSPVVNVAISDDYIGYYTCGVWDAGKDCNTLYKITGINLIGDKYYIDGYAYNYKEVSSFESEVGLYQVEVGNNTGKYSYIYRGEVKNNNVLFGDIYWKIIRINEDGTIRMIYNGTTLSSDGNKTAGAAATIGRTAFNTLYGPTATGYMYNISSTPLETNYNITESFDSSTSYKWAESYTYTTDANGMTLFTLSSGTNNYPLVQKTTSEMMNDSAQLAKTPYTCKVTTGNGSCVFIIKVNTLSSATSGSVRYVSKNYNSVAEAQQNVYDSVVKKKVDTWYVNTFSIKQNNGKNVTTYLADEVFCNDRSMGSSYNSGYLLNARTNYNGRERNVVSSNPSLYCNQKNDAFTVNDTVNGNGALTYPVGMITTDEVSFAGRIEGYKNERYYLQASIDYRTMTPNSYRTDSANYRTGIMDFVEDTGKVNSGVGTADRYVRPVINLKANTEINAGDGTATNPYIID